MKDFDYDTPKSQLKGRIDKLIDRLELQGRVPRHETMMLVPYEGELGRMGNHSFYNKYGLYPANKRVFPETKTAAWQEVIDRAHSRIFVKDGVYNGTKTIVGYPDQGSDTVSPTPSLGIEGESIPNAADPTSASTQSQVRYILNSPTNPIPLLTFPEQTTVGNGLALSLRNLQLMPTYPSSGAYAAPVIDIENFGLYAMELENLVLGPTSELSSDTTPPPSGSVGLQIGQNNSKGFVQGGTRKWARNVLVGGCETGYAVTVDWVTWERCLASNYNLYGFRHGNGSTTGNSPLQNRYIGCHAVFGAGAGFYDDSIGAEQPYAVTVEDFYLEQPNTNSGFITTTYAIHPNTWGRYGSIINNGHLPDFDPSITAGFGYTALQGYTMSISDSGFLGQPLMPSTVANWNRWASTTPSFSAGTSYRNVNAALMKVTLGVTLNPTSTAPAYAWPGIVNANPSVNTTYTGTVGALNVPAGLTSSDGEIGTLTFTVPPLWWFALVLSNATLGSYTITYEPVSW